MDKYDFVTLFGLILVAAGLYFVYWPLALIVPGVVFVVIGVIAARRNAQQIDDR